MSRIAAFALFALTAALVHAQSFEAASIKPFPEGGTIVFSGCEGGPGSNDPGRINCEYVTLKMLLMRAYHVKNQEIFGPNWLDSEHFNIVAKAPPGATKDQVAAMFQNLLAERFQVALHHETRQLTGYSLEISKGGLKMKEAAPPAATNDDAPTGPPPVGKDGFPILRPSVLAAGPIILFRQGRARLQASNATLSALAESLSNYLDRVINDETGLGGKYGMTLNWTPAPNEQGGRQDISPPSDEPEVNLFVALEQQLGLRLVSKKIPRDTLVIDRAAKAPAEN